MVYQRKAQRPSLTALGVLVVIAAAVGGEAPIIEDGKPNAEIVISSDPKRPRMVNMAALELQFYLERISGARLPIVAESGGKLPVRIYVGRSEHTDRLGVNGDGLKYGAFRMVSGPSHLVLLGHDFDFAPPEPWNTSHNDTPRAVKEWDKLVGDRTDAAWGYPFRLLYRESWNRLKFSEIMAQRYGRDSERVWNPRALGWSRTYQGPGGGHGIWEQDEGGSLNAVCAFLRSLGVRWYMPVADIGEVVPKRETIVLPSVSKTDRPDFDLRSWYWYNYAGFPFEHVMWARRLGMNFSFQTLGYTCHAHGLMNVHARKEMQQAHPDYYALRKGKRETGFRGTGHVCFSSEGFFRETVNYARFMYDQYGQPHVSVWPQDGLLKCECASCRKLSPSDLVWGFTDRVARELYQSHPDRLVTAGAYTTYLNPPTNVKKFTPNVLVFVSNCGRPLFDDPARWKVYWDRLQEWRRKVAPGNIMRVENNRYGLGRKFPVIHPHNMAKDLRALKGMSRGECCEEAQERMRWHSPGMDHLTLYVQARFLRDASQDVDALLEEYYTLFYGPAREEMKAAIEFAEARYSRTDTSKSGGRCDPRNVPLADRVRLGELLHAAREKAGDTVYGKRVQVIIDELPPLEELRREFAKQAEAGDPRAEAPVVVAQQVRSRGQSRAYTFSPHFGWREQREAPKIPTTFRVNWDADALHFDIRCQEPDMKRLNVAKDVWAGDAVVILLESPSHTYYHIEINPAGRIYDARRSGGGRVNARWESLTRVKTEKGRDYWRVRARVPIAIPGRQGAEGNPMKYVIGPKLSSGAKWYLNIARRRKRPAVANRHFKDMTAVFSKSRPFHLRKIHVPDNFAKLEIR